jgi:hypothetical protein
VPCLINQVRQLQEGYNAGDKPWGRCNATDGKADGSKSETTSTTKVFFVRLEESCRPEPVEGPFMVRGR